MLLEAKKLDKSFNGVYALKGLDLSLKEGEIHGLVGENGAGKSTFIKILGGVYTKNGGELSWNGAPFPADFGPVESRELHHKIRAKHLLPTTNHRERSCENRRRTRQSADHQSFYRKRKISRFMISDL